MARGFYGGLAFSGCSRITMVEFKGSYLLELSLLAAVADSCHQLLQLQRCSLHENLASKKLMFVSGYGACELSSGPGLGVFSHGLPMFSSLGPITSDVENYQRMIPNFQLSPNKETPKYLQLI